jgi:hypothetical protein
MAAPPARRRAALLSGGCSVVAGERSFLALAHSSLPATARRSRTLE